MLLNARQREGSLVPLFSHPPRLHARAQTFPDSADGADLPEGMVAESARGRLQRNLLGALAVLLIDRSCRRPYLLLEGVRGGPCRGRCGAQHWSGGKC